MSGLYDGTIEPKTCKDCGLQKLRSEFYAAGNKDGLRGNCKSCFALKQKANYEADKAAAIAKVREWKLANKEKVLASNARTRAKKREVLKIQSLEYYYKNKEKLLAGKTKWRERNRERIAATDAAWEAKNRVSRNARASLRRARKLRATPPWANLFFIEEAFDLAKRRTQLLGVKWSVDHVIPLISKKVCGLHAENNIAVITLSENSKKNNKRWPDMPSEVRA